MRQTTMLFVLLAGALSLALFSVKYQVQDLEGELANLNRSIKAEQQAIRVLKAEWSHLNNPERLRGLAERHLGLDQVRPDQMQTLQIVSDKKGQNVSDKKGETTR
jgi:cell division protein FtsL